MTERNVRDDKFSGSVQGLFENKNEFLLLLEVLCGFLGSQLCGCKDSIIRFDTQKG